MAQPNEQNKLLAAALIGCSFFPALLAGIAVKAWVLTYLWLWFLTEPFKIPAVGLIHAWGLMMLVNLLVPYSPPKHEPSDNPIATYVGIIIGHLVGPLIALGVGYFAHSLMGA